MERAFAGSDGCFICVWNLIIEHLVFGINTTWVQSVHHLLVGLYHFAWCSVLCWFHQNRIAVHFSHHHHILVALTWTYREFSCLISIYLALNSSWMSITWKKCLCVPFWVILLAHCRHHLQHRYHSHIHSCLMQTPTLMWISILMDFFTYNFFVFPLTLGSIFILLLLWGLANMQIISF